MLVGSNYIAISDWWGWWLRCSFSLHKNCAGDAYFFSSFLIDSFDTQPSRIFPNIIINPSLLIVCWEWTDQTFDLLGPEVVSHLNRIDYFITNMHLDNNLSVFLFFFSLLQSTSFSTRLSQIWILYLWLYLLKKNRHSYPAKYLRRIDAWNGKGQNCFSNDPNLKLVSFFFLNNAKQIIIFNSLVRLYQYELMPRFLW